jgi:hypothetical protein
MPTQTEAIIVPAQKAEFQFSPIELEDPLDDEVCLPSSLLSAGQNVHEFYANQSMFVEQVVVKIVACGFVSSIRCGWE